MRLAKIVICLLLVFCSVASYALIVPSAPFVTVEAAQIATVTGNGVNVRSNAGTDSNVLVVAAKGSQYTVTGSKKDSDGNVWYAVSVNGKTGYIIEDYVTVSEAATTTTTVKNASVLTAKTAAGVYASPTKSSSKSATMTAGAQYTYSSVYTGGDGVKWYLVTVGASRGWVCATDVTIGAAAPTTTTTTAAQNKSVLTAKSAAGVYASPAKSSAKSATMTAGQSYYYTSVYTGGDKVKWYLVTVGASRGWVCQSDITLGGTVTTSSTTASTTTSTTTTTTATSATTTTTTAPSGDVLTAKNAAGVYASPTKSSAKSATMTAGQSYYYTSVYTGGDKVKWYLVTVGASRGWVCQSDITLGGTVTTSSTTASTTTSTTTTTTATSATTTTTTAPSGDVLTAKNAAGVYASPTKSSAKSATMTAGQSYYYTSVYTGGDKVKWYLVTVGASRGWVCQSDITLGGTVTTSSTTSTTSPTTTTTIPSGDVLTANSAAGVYASPTKSSAKSATMTAGQKYYYTSVYTGGDRVKWYLVTVGASRGWVCETDITLGEGTTTTTTAAASESDKMITANSAAGVYASPTKSSAKSATMTAGKKYSYASVYTGGDNVKWYLVTVGSARGWVCETDVTVDKTQEIYNRLDGLRAKFPNGKYWNHYGSSKANLDGWTDTPCPSGHYLNGVQQCNGQCDGFARKLGLDLFGLSTYSWKRTTYDINTVCVGDIIRYNSKHTIMVVGFTSDPNTIIVADCNWDYHCQISWDRKFSTSRYFSTVNWVMHYPENTLNRQTYLNNLPS